MPSKLQFYAQMADHTAEQITGSYQKWTAFLTTAARLYKYPYHEQLMIYAQRPDATACADYELWNKQMNRYVRRGSQGIALIDTSGDNPRLKYVFDVSDTGGGENSRRPFLWEYRDEHESIVTAALEDRFEVGGAVSFPDLLEHIATFLVDDYWYAHKQDILDIVDGSFLDGYDEENIHFAFNEAAVASAAYVMLARCGLEPDARYEHIDFMSVFDFNTPQAAAILGSAVSQVSEQVLRQIEVTIKNYEREKLAERSQNHERTDLHEERGLPVSQSEPVPAGGTAPGQVREDAESVPEGASPGAVEQPDPVRAAVPPSAGDRRNGEQPSGTDDARTDESGGGDGIPESQRSHEVGGANEHPESAGGGSDPDRAGVQLNLFGEPVSGEQLTMFPSEAAQIQYIAEAESVKTAPSAFSMPQEYIDLFLQMGCNTVNHRTEIVNEYTKQKPMESLTDFLKQTYKGGYGIQFGDTKVSAWYAEDGMHLAYGGTAEHSRTAQIVTWDAMAARIGELLEQGQFATNTELAEAFTYEKQQVSKVLWFMRQDMSDAAKEKGYMSIFTNLRGAFPTDTEKLFVYLSEPESCQAILNEVRAFAEAYREDSSLMRSRLYNPNRLLRAMEEIVMPRREYATDMAKVPEIKGFITEDEIQHYFAGGNDIQDTKARIYDFFQQPHTPKEKTAFLKRELGTSTSGNNALSNNIRSHEAHSNKGIRFEKPYCTPVELSWTKIVKYTDDLMATGRFYTPEQLARKQELEAQEAAKKLAAEQPQPEAKADSPIWDYNGIKHDHPDDIVLYQMGDFFEMYGEDAILAAQKLDLNLTTRSIPSGGRVKMCGVSAHQLEQYVERLRENYGVTIAATQDGSNERKVYSLAATSPETVQANTAPAQPTIREQYERYKPVVIAAVTEDTAYRNACGHSDRENAVIEGNAAVRRAILASGDMELIRLFSDVPEFRTRLHKEVIEETYPRLHELLRPISQDDIDDALRAWNGDADSKQAVVRYMEQHGREKDTAAWLCREYGGSDTKSLFVVRAGSPESVELPWPKVQRRIAQLIKEDSFLTQQEQLTETRDYSAEYHLLDRLRSDCEYFLGAGQRSEKHLWAGNVRSQIAKMRELYDTLPNKPEWLTKEAIDSYADRMAPPYLVVAYHHLENGFDEKLDYQTLEEAEKAAQGYVDGTMESDGFAYDGAAVYDQQERKYLRIYGDYPDEKAHAQVKALTQEPVSAVREPDPEEVLDGNPVSIQIGGEWQTFPNVKAAEEAAYEESKAQIRRNAQNFHITDDALGVGGAKAKFQANINAIKLLKYLEADNRQATPEQQEVLSRYVGWGGLADAFDPNKENWRTEYAELKELLTPEEYAAAKSSVLNAHYTSPVVIKAIYEAVGNMGFKTGNILEPSMGVGNFFGMLPEEMKDSRLYGVELDSITGRIAKQLYPKADITVAGFETTDRRDFYDLAIGNVPFGQYQVNDRAYNKLGFSIHDYFFAKSLDQVRPGGVVAFVTSRYTMDKQSPEVRKYIAQRAELLGAIRLPNNAFKANAGTEVVSDILFLQKRDRPIDIEPDWVHLGKNEDGFSINSYFIDHPEMILGRQSSESTQYGKQDFTVEPIEGLSLADQLHDAVKNIRGTYQEAELPDLGDGEAIDTSIPADPNVKNFSYTIVDGEVYFRENSRMVKPDLNATAKERVKGLVELRDCVHHLIDLQMWDSDPIDIRKEQQRLNELYDAFSAKYGLINDRGNRLAFGDDSAYYLLCSLEVLDEDGKLERKADMFSKRTIKQARAVTSVDTASEALAVSISEKARVDIPYMSQLSGKSEDELVSELRGVIFRLPEPVDAEGRPKYVTADEYLSGNVRQKLEQAKRAARDFPEVFSINVEALTAAQPKDLEASEIDVRLGATWIDKKYIQEFMEELLNPPYYARRDIQVKFSPFTAEWNITGKTRVGMRDVNAYMTYGTSRASAYKILEETLNLRDVRIYDTVEDPDGKERRVLNQKETTLAQQKQQAIKDAFQEWIWKDPERRQTLVQLYNEKFNAVRPREYDGSHITFSGMNPEITLREHQKNAIAHVLYGGNTLLAHEVGAGKTFEMIGAAMESKRLGLCQKSLFAVPNHLTEQWASEFLRLYPSAKILVAKKKDFEAQNRKKFCAKIATGDYDAVIIGHSQFERIPVSQERQERLLHEQIMEIEIGLEELRASGAEKFTIKSLERTKKGLETRLKKLQDGSRKDDVVTFEQLGVDRLFVDEAHSYKNLFLYTKMRNVAGLSTTDAQKSSDMLLKCRYIDEMTGGKGVVFATGTPVSNSMTELYTMMRYLQHDMLKAHGWAHFDCWASQFGETKTAIELAPEGTGYRARTRFAKFFNLPELITLWKECADVKTADQLNLPRPTAVYHNEVAQPTEQQKALVQELSQRAALVHSGTVDPSKDNMLKITSDGRKLGLDQRIINPNLPDDPGSKVNMCVGNIMRIWQDGQADKLTQLVFCDISTPKSRAAPEKVAAKAPAGNLDSPELHALENMIPELEPEPQFTVYEDIRSKLIDQGIPPEQIAFIHDANTEARKKELFAKVRTGQVRVLIGSTFKMGAGMNVQDRLIALHDLDCPWRPGDLEQRSGRIIRQGNKNPEVHIYRYVTEGTFDSYLWQTVENKQKFISQIMTSKSPVRSCEDVDETALSYAEIKALCAGDPRIKEKMDLDIDVARLKLLKADHLSQQYRLEDNLLKHFPEQIEKVKGLIAAFKTDIETLAAHPHPENGFAGMVVKGDALTDKDNAGAALLEACKEATGLDPVEIGTYRGFTMSVTLEDFGKEYVLTLKGEMPHRVSLGKDARGNLIRIDNALNEMSDWLRSQEAQLQNLYTQVETAKAELGKPFPQEAELRQKSERLAELNALLDIDGKTGHERVADDAIVAKSSRPSVLDKLRTPAVHGSAPKSHTRKEEVR